MAATSTMFFYVLERWTLTIPSQVVSIMLCVTRESRPSTHMKLILRNFNLLLLCSRQLRKQGFLLLFSENFASSTRCLDELVNILECMKMKNQLVWPIFFKVEPWEVRNQKGRFGEAMLKLEKWLQNYPYRILQWKKALHQVSLIAGWNYGAEYVLLFYIPLVAT